MRQTTTTIVRSSGLFVRWTFAVVMAIFAWFFITPLFTLLLPHSLERGVSVGGALLDNWFLTVLAAGVSVGAFWALLSAIRHTARARARTEVVVSTDGMELVSHRRRWYRGRRAVVRWDDVQVISAQRILVRESAGRTTQQVPREALDIYLTRPIADLPDFASLATLEESPLAGVSGPVHRLRIAGPGNKLAASVRKLTSNVGAARPDLFYRGTSVDQWFAPEAPPQAPVPTLRRHKPEPPPPEGQPAEFALSAPLWLDYNYRPGCALIGLALGVAAGGTGYLGIVYLSERDGGILLGLLGILCALVLTTGVIITLTSLVYLPRAVVRTGILLDSEGLEVVEKRRWGIGQARGLIPWHDVQAIVYRESTLVRVSAAANKTENPAIDLYLHGDAPFTKPGAGVAMRLSRLPRADSTATQGFVRFPALRVRFPHFAEEDTETDVALWRDLPTEGTGPHRLPGSQLRAALYAARPDLCHGFTDADRGGDERT